MAETLFQWPAGVFGNDRMAYYGVGGAWCFSSGAFVGHLKLMFIRGAEMKPEPRNADWKGQVHTRGRSDLGGRSRRVQVALWMKQAAANPFFGAKKR